MAVGGLLGIIAARPLQVRGHGRSARLFLLVVRALDGSPPMQPS